MLKAYGEFWKKYFNFTDKSTVADYWWAVLCNTIVSAILFIITIAGLFTGIASLNSESATGAGFILLIIGLGLLMLWGLATVIPNAAIMVRRLRDVGLSPWWGLLLIASALLPNIARFNMMNGAQNELIYANFTGDYSSVFTNLMTSNIILLSISFLISIFFFVVSLLPSRVATTSEEKAATAKVEASPAETTTAAKTTAKKPAAKKTATTKKTTAEKVEPKKPATKKTTTTKKATAAKKPAAKTTTKKATTAKKPAAKKTTTTKKAAPKTAAKKTTTTKKAAPKKTTAAKTTTKKTTAKKTTGDK